MNKEYHRSRAVVKSNPRFALRKTALSFFTFFFELRVNQISLVKTEIFACRTSIKVVITTGAQQEIARKPTDVIFLDLSKAFDSVPHERLLLKLNRHGIDGPLLLWCRNFLTSRQQRVTIRGTFSIWSIVISGVPQGSSYFNCIHFHFKYHSCYTILYRH